jgi:dTDP-glucose pyrophosphorylase
MAPKEIDRESFLNSIVHYRATLEVAIKHMLHEAAMVVDDEQKLCGVITDGDVRRAFLAGANMQTPITELMTKTPLTIPQGLPAKEILAIMIKEQVRHLPIVNDDNEPVGLELLKNQYEDSDFAEAVLMAGGKGTRLRPLTYSVPKPLLDIGNGTIIDNVLNGLKSSGVNDVIISVNYLGDQIKDHVSDGTSHEMNVAYVEETKALGTAGSLSLLSPRPSRNFIVMNADLLTEMDFRALSRFHKEEQNDLSVCVRKIKQAIPYGVVTLDKDNSRIDSIVEKPEYDILVNAGIYMLEPKIIDLIPDGKFYDMVSLIKNAMANGYKVGAFPILEYWRDIGQHSEMNKAIQELTEKLDGHVLKQSEVEK